MSVKEKQIRVAVTLYKLVQRPLISGDFVEENPIIIPQEEVRFWVRKIELVKADNVHLAK